MFCRGRNASSTAFLILLCAAACSSPKHGVERIAVAPFENQSADTQIDWMGRIAPVMIALQSSGAPNAVVIAVTRAGDTSSVRATRVVEGYYDRSGGELRFHAVLRDLKTGHNVAEANAAGPVSNGPQALLQTIAAKLAGKARDLVPIQNAALEHIGKSLLAENREDQEQLLKQALEADPKSSFAAANLAQRMLQMGQGAEARTLLSSTMQKVPEGWERTQLRLALATIEGNGVEATGALQDAVRMSPYDSELTRQLSETYLNRHQYTEALQWAKKTTEIDPREAAFWNVRAYASSYAGDEKDALVSLEQYRKLAPNDPNSYDTSGEVQWFFGKFAEAEKEFVEAQQKSPQFLGGLEFAKAALARFLSGDVGGADEIFRRYMETRRALNDPLADLREAHWLRLTGRMDKAMTQAGEVVKRGGEVGALAEVYQSFWLLESGKAAQATEKVRHAVSTARTPATVTQGAIVAFLAQPAASVEEWNARAEKALNPRTPPSLRRLMVAYALLLGKHFHAAAQLLEPIWQNTPPATGDELRMLLGYAKLQSGDKAGAAKLMRRFPLPPQPGESILSSVWFPAFQQWRKQAGL